MNSPYLLLPVGILTILFYAFSFLLFRIGVITKTLHRKIWNVLLLITFLVTALLGLLLVVQINYKLEWNIIESVIKWHVDFGIAMSIVAIFHLIWHWNYYINLFKTVNYSNKQKNLEKNEVNITQSRLRLLIFLSGFVSIVVQVLLIREVTTVFQGNELMMGWTIGVWMILTGAGAFWGSYCKYSKSSEKLLYNILLLLSILPIILVILLYLVKNGIFPVGIMVHPGYFILLLIIFLSPVCLLSGFVFSLLVGIYRTSDNGFIKVYAFEAIGSLVGGIFASLVFIQWFSILQSLFILAFLVVLILSYIRKAKTLKALAYILLIFFLTFFFLPVDHVLKSFLFPNQKILKTKETYYGNLTITENAGQYNIFENGSLFFTTENIIENEEGVHYVMLQHKKPQSILLISGGISGMIEEILKYKSVKNIDYLELNPQLISLASKYKPIPSNNKVHIFYEDGRRYIQRTNKRYDVVILAIPDPSSLQVNRFYTVEFLIHLKKRLNPDAYIMYGISSAGNYLSNEKSNEAAAMYNSLKYLFNYVDIIPGEKDYYIASNSFVNIKISDLLASRNIENQYVNNYYLNDYIIQQRNLFIKNDIKKKRILNTDDKPVSVFFHTLHFISQFSSKSRNYLVIPVLLLLIPFFFMRPVSSGMYIAGFTLASLELLLIFSFQIFYGYVYSAIGIIIAVFMGGLAVGALLGNKYTISRKHFLTAQILLIIYALFFIVMWKVQKNLATTFFSLMLFFIMAVIPSAIVGFQYVACTKLLPVNTIKAAPRIYATDLLGSALGVIVITLILLPLFGIIYSCFIIAGLNFLCLIYSFCRK